MPILDNRKRQGKILRFSLIALGILLICISLYPHMAFAKPASNPISVKASYHLKDVKWVEKSEYFLCKAKGKKLKAGIFKIGQKYYLFDKNGHQLTGWRKVGKKYCCFRTSNKAGGYMYKNRSVNGVKVNKNGIAVLNKVTKLEMPNLIEAQKFVDENIKPAWSKSKKMKVTFDILVNEYQYGPNLVDIWSLPGTFQASVYFFTSKIGPCYLFASGYAFIANAIGCKNCEIVYSSCHGWAEIDGLIYDPQYSQAHPEAYIYAIDPSMSMTGFIPDYLGSRLLVKRVGLDIGPFKNSDMNSA